MSVDEHINVFLGEIQEAEIREPGAGEYVDSCHYSRTGFAIWRQESEGEYCTCNPSNAPSDIGHAIECAAAAFAVLIERAASRSERKALIKERDDIITKLKAEA